MLHKRGDLYIVLILYKFILIISYLSVMGFLLDFFCVIPVLEYIRCFQGVLVSKYFIIIKVLLLSDTLFY